MPTLFEEKVLDYCRAIPRGKVITYKMLAKLIGRPKAVRAVANALGKNQKLIDIPCHRVVKSNGCLGGYARGTTVKKNILKKEGIVINNNTINLSKHLFNYN